MSNYISCVKYNQSKMPPRKEINFDYNDGAVKPKEPTFGPRDNIPKNRLVTERTKAKIKDIMEMPLNNKEGSKINEYDKKKLLVCVTGQQAS